MVRYLCNYALLGIFLVCTSSVYGADDVNAIIWDFSQYQVKPANVAKSAVYALINRGWDVQKVDKNSATGSLEEGKYEVLIQYDAFPKVQISFTKDNSRPKPKWLGYLRDDIFLSLVSCVQ